jgi:hypothetical protein
VTKKYDKEIVRKLNAAMREGRYTEALWKEITGKSAEELGQEWKQTLPGAAPAKEPAKEPASAGEAKN